MFFILQKLCSPHLLKIKIMLFKVGDEIIDTSKTPIGLVFKTKEEAKAIADILANIKNGDTKLPVDGNGNWWIMHPSKMTKDEIDEWSTLTDEQKEILENNREVHPVKFEL